MTRAGEKLYRRDENEPEHLTRWEYAIGAVAVMATAYGLVPIVKGIASAAEWISALFR